MKIAIYLVDENVTITSGAVDDLSPFIPADVPFWYVEREDLPDSPPETWELTDMGEPDGYGNQDQSE